jgi:hypothetical protein
MSGPRGTAPMASSGIIESVREVEKEFWSACANQPEHVGARSGAARRARGRFGSQCFEGVYQINMRTAGTTSAPGLYLFVSLQVVFARRFGSDLVLLLTLSLLCVSMAGRASSANPAELLHPPPGRGLASR